MLSASTLIAIFVIVGLFFLNVVVIWTENHSLGQTRRQKRKVKKSRETSLQLLERKRRLLHIREMEAEMGIKPPWVPWDETEIDQIWTPFSPYKSDTIRK